MCVHLWVSVIVYACGPNLCVCLSLDLYDILKFKMTYNIRHYGHRVNSPSSDKRKLQSTIKLYEQCKIQRKILIEFLLRKKGYVPLKILVVIL